MKYLLTLMIALTMYLPAPVEANNSDGMPRWKSWLCQNPNFGNGLAKWCGTGRGWERNA